MSLHRVNILLLQRKVSHFDNMQNFTEYRSFGIRQIFSQFYYVNYYCDYEYRKSFHVKCSNTVRKLVLFPWMALHRLAIAEKSRKQTVTIFTAEKVIRMSIPWNFIPFGIESWDTNHGTNLSNYFNKIASVRAQIPVFYLCESHFPLAHQRKQKSLTLKLAYNPH